MLVTLIGPMAGVILFITMLIFLEVGRFLGKRQLKRLGEKAHASITVTEGAVFALMGLIVAFTFSGASTRFDQRRELIIEESNAIMTAYLRAGLLETKVQSILQEDIRQYLKTRLDSYKNITNEDMVDRNRAEMLQLQGKIWHEALAAAKSEKNYAASVVLLPALNNMIDIANTRLSVRKIHPPLVIFILLVGLALFSALLAGYSMGGTKLHSSLHIIGFTAITALTIYVTLDMEYPRVGLIRVDSFDEVLRETEADLNNASI